jgi:hypothetical protein
LIISRTFTLQSYHTFIERRHKNSRRKVLHLKL